MEVSEPERSGDLWRIDVTAGNRGRSTAAGVEIEGLLAAGDVIVESHTVTLNYLPAESQRSSALLFRHDPGEYEVTIRVTGYRAP